MIVVTVGATSGFMLSGPSGGPKKSWKNETYGFYDQNLKFPDLVRKSLLILVPNENLTIFNSVLN